jgi:glycosyltransferase domain-containing protein
LIDKEMSECTLIMPTYRRPAYVERALQYYSLQGAGIYIILADAGTAEARQINAKSVAKSTRKGLKVNHLELTSEPASLAGQIYAAVQQVETPYTMFISDDDFVGRNFIESAVQHLESTPQSAAVCGDRLSFRVKGDGARGKMMDLKMYAPPFHKEPTAIERILSMERRCAARLQTFNLMDAVSRTAHFREYAKILIESRDLDPDWRVNGYTTLGTCVDELLKSFLTLSQGELHAQAGLNVGINYHSEQTGKAIFGRMDLLDVLTHPLWPRAWQFICETGAKAVARADGCGVHEARKAVESAAWTRLACGVNKTVRQRDFEVAELFLGGELAPQAGGYFFGRLARWLHGKTKRCAYERTPMRGKLPKGEDYQLMKQVVGNSPSEN